jgi:DNA-binding LacI/PurR family transcriptional regulator
MSKKAGVVARIRQDIQNRRLRPGHSYLSTREVAEMAGVSTMTASRALQELAEQGLLERQPGVGTVVGQGWNAVEDNAFTHVHLLTPEDFYAINVPLLDSVASTLRRALPFDSIQWTFVPAADGREFTKRLIAQASKAGNHSAYALIYMPAHIQRLFAQAGLPAIVCGSVYPCDDALPSINADALEVGQSLMDYLLDKGCRRVGLILRDHLTYGDSQMMQGALKALADRGLPPDALEIVCSPDSTHFAEAVVEKLFEEAVPPEGLLCHSYQSSQAALNVLDRRGLHVPDEVVVVTADQTVGRTPELPHMDASMLNGEYLEQLSRALKQLFDGEAPNPRHYVVQTRLATSLDFEGQTAALA